jgi:FixJ family two-component response regulator
VVDDPRHQDHVGHSERDLRERDQLTPQERQIAMLAAAGLNNKQIGQRLFLSHRTVGAHLYQIFPNWASHPGPRCVTRWPPSRRTGDGENRRKP